MMNFNFSKIIAQEGYTMNKGGIQLSVGRNLED